MSRHEALAQLAALKSGKKRSELWQEQQAEDIYDEVDEEGYKKLLRKRLDEEDFVVDDNDLGYADDGREEWDTGPYYSDSEEEQPLKGKAAKRKAEEDKAKKENENHKIHSYFQGPAAASQKPKRPQVKPDETEFLSSLLSGLDQDVSSPTPAASKRPPPKKQGKPEHRTKRVRITAPPPPRPKTPRARSPADDLLPSNDIDMDDAAMVNSSKDNDNFLSSDIPMPSSPVAKVVERKSTTNTSTDADSGIEKAKEEDGLSDDDMMLVEEAAATSSMNARNININGQKPPPVPQIPSEPVLPSSPPPKSAKDVDASTWNDVNDKSNIISSPMPDFKSFGKLRAQDAAEEDGSLSFFWLDYVEVNGSLCLFGKVRNHESGGFSSAFIKINNILRKLYFLPRQYRLSGGRNPSEEIGMEDVYGEVDSLMSKLRVRQHKIKPCTRKYAFEIPGIPKEAEYLKLMYPYEDSAMLTPDTTGETFSHVFGSNTSLFEQFVLWKRIMGPCWLKIQEADFSAVSNASWCKLECLVTNPASISVFPNTDNIEPPTLTLMSLALRTKLNVKENKQEILVASARVYENVSLGDATAPEKLPCKTFTVMRPLESNFPIGFETETRKHRGTFMLEKSEQFLLSKLLAIYERTDPDVLMGHQLQDVDFNILLSRLREKGTPGWHRLGRLKRSEWPKNLSKGSSFFAERQIVAGRLICDLANDMGRSLTLKCQSYSLTEMTQQYLGSGSVRREIDSDAALKTWATSKDGFMNYISHCETDTFFIAALVLKLQMLPLTKVLTNLAGNSWARTLSGTRAERNEYILLHEFHRNKYICPDKYANRRSARHEENDDNDDGLDKKKKDKYKGGLVFDPQRGLYDKYVLVLDFNSLYPSIIQEYNICFTTVDRSLASSNESEEKVPDVPVEQVQGLLPRLIATLVNRRREVKRLMKDRNATPEDLAMWDTKQLALKLTANSMYGCLGYTQSRFYAKPLAMLITFKGREVLRSTKSLAESNQLQVIYGDTDSVMINTNADNIEAAIKVGNVFKRSVNEQYKLLEIDIDNIFRRLLLHAKKKYAAINVTEHDGKYVDQLEVKGLDMRRREYCALSKEVSQKLLNEILSGEDPEVVINNIHEYLHETSEKMRELAFPFQKYVIYTKLSKRPEEYPNKETMPPAQVALRELARGKNIRPGDVISYIVTSGDAQTANLPPAKRSYTLQDVIKPGSELKPDTEYYLLKQIFPPIERLCAPIPETDTVRLAECLGLDTRKYQIHSHVTQDKASMDVFPLESQIPDSMRFKDAARFNLRCRYCRNQSQFLGLLESPESCTPDGFVCCNQDCQQLIANISVVAQLESQIREQTSQYYEGWLVCDDPACGNRTRQMSVYGHRCLGPRGRAEGCRGRMVYEYSEKKMYNQLLYFASLFDMDKALEGAKKEKDADKRAKIEALITHNRLRFDTLKGVVDAYLKKCGRQWVEMDTLFGFAMKR